MEHPPEPAAVVDRRTVAELGVTIVRFANGVEAWFKPTDFKNDQVLFSLTASGGASLAPAPLYPEATLAPALVQLSGVGGHSAVDLQKLLAGKIAAASPFVIDLVSRHLGLEHAREPRNRAPAAQSGLHRAGQRPAGVRAHHAAARGRRTRIATTTRRCCSARRWRR